ncbi:MAG TPA: aminopeptidase P family protein [Thermoanaerobacterales bacterium]|nr:aminopeptidase P family protein [Thermoanaerobacterales bacterium]
MKPERISKLADSLKEQNIGAVLVGPSPDLEYLTGLTPSQDERFKGLFVLSDGSFFYITPSLYLEETQKCIGYDVKLYVWYDEEGFLGVLKQASEDFKLQGLRIAVSDGISAVHLLDIQKTIDGDFVKGNILLGELRMIKDAEELDNLRKASAIIDDVVKDLFEFIRPGIRERDIKKKIEELCLEKGASGLSFDPIVASGPNSSMPHYNGDSRIIEKRDIVLLDLGCKYNGYCSDTTRTFFVGEPSEKEKSVYAAVLEANLAAEAFIREGVTCEEVDKMARDVLKKAGLDKYFITRTGHGIGVNIHEYPNIVANNKQILQNGMVFSIEPSVCIPGEFGIRIEDIVVVNEGKAEILNKFTKEMLVI